MSAFMQVLPSRLRAACHLPYPVRGVGLLRIASAFKVLFLCMMQASSPATSPPFLRGISLLISTLHGRRQEIVLLHTLHLFESLQQKFTPDDGCSFAFLIMDKLLVCKSKHVFQDIQYRSENIISTVH